MPPICGRPRGSGGNILRTNCECKRAHTSKGDFIENSGDPSLWIAICMVLGVVGVLYLLFTGQAYVLSEYWWVLALIFGGGVFALFLTRE